MTHFHLPYNDYLENIDYLQFNDQTVATTKVDIKKTYLGEFSESEGDLPGFIQG